MSTNFLPACLDEPAAVTCFFARASATAPPRPARPRPGRSGTCPPGRDAGRPCSYRQSPHGVPVAGIRRRKARCGTAGPRSHRRGGPEAGSPPERRYAPGRAAGFLNRAMLAAPGGHHRAGPGRPHARSHLGGRSVSDSQRSARVRIPPQSAALRSTPTETPSRRTGTAFQLFSKENRHQTAHALTGFNGRR